MLNDRFIKTTFMLSILGHCLLLLIPKLNSKILPNQGKNIVIMVDPEIDMSVFNNIETEKIMQKESNKEIEKKSKIFIQEAIEESNPFEKEPVEFNGHEKLDIIENPALYDENILEIKTIKLGMEDNPHLVLEEMPSYSHSKIDMKIRIGKSENDEEPFFRKKSLNGLENKTLIRRSAGAEEGLEPAPTVQNVIHNYQGIIKQKIENSKTYPVMAQRHGIEGKIFVYFTISSNGLTDDIKIVSSSGSEILDKEAIAAVKRASPFPPIPKELNCSCLNIKVAIVFSLS
ncbi:MAG: energy transducer TonB [bacterium]